MGDNQNIDKKAELEKAYSSDVERKLVREDELNAAKDYLTVLLQEVEGRSVELEGKRQEADELRERLSNMETRIDDLTQKERKGEKHKNIALLWLIVAAAECVVIVVFCILFLFEKQSEVNTQGNGGVKDAGGNVSQGQQVIQESLTAKHCDNLIELAKNFDRVGKEFECSVAVVDGLEYLCFSNKDLKIYYKNEYYKDEVAFRKAIIVSNGEKRLTFSDAYDFENGVTRLCPTITTLQEHRMLVFVSDSKDSELPDDMRIIDTRDLMEYRSTDLNTRLVELLNPEFISDENDSNRMLLRLTTSKAVYNYEVPESFVADMQYSEMEVIDVKTEFNMSIEASEIKWKTLVRCGDEYVLGALEGSFTATGGKISIAGAKYGAFVPLNQEDTDKNGIITPVSHAPEEYLTIYGNNSERFYVAVLENVPLNDYNWENLNNEDTNNWIYYDSEGNQLSHRGIDVSKYQETIDWKKVAAEGVEFAIVRLGFRGMNEGTLEFDKTFRTNMKEASANGIKTGVYFFSQAVNEKEAVEEAEFVIKALKDYDVAYPVVFDTEKVTSYNARANSLSVEERTAVCRAFCNKIAEAGYTPMIYANTKYMVMGIDLSKLTDIDKWYAIYSSEITLPYDFQILQYSEKGSIAGIKGNVDLNISFKEYGSGKQ